MRKVTVVVAALLLLSACSRQPRQAEAPWGQGYETQSGYMQPDHGWFYYWMLYHVLWSNPQPTYHVYVVPPGMPPTYRPWTPTYRATTSAAAPRATVTSPRTSGGFSAPSPASPSPRNSGGFSRPSASPSPSPRSSGGFSSRPSSSPRSSPSSSPRSSGGFGKR